MSISFLNLENSPKIKDGDWLSNCFMLSSKNVPEAAFKGMLVSSASMKFTDTRIGGNKAINMPPAYTRFADPRAGGLNRKNSSSMKNSGQGEYWSDQIDENAQLIYVQFGLPTHRGMLSFFSGASNIEAGLLARTGRSSITFFAGQVVGFVVGLRLLPFILAGTAIKFLINRTGSRYYNLKPAMHPYWNRVNLIANMIAVSEGLVDGTTNDSATVEAMKKAGSSVEDSSTPEGKRLTSYAHVACPELFRENGGGVDIYRVVSRYQELAKARREFLEDVAKQENVDGLIERVIRYSYTDTVSAGQIGIEEARKIHDTEYANDVSHDARDNFTTNSMAAAGALQGALASNVIRPGDDQAVATGLTDQTNATASNEATADRNYVTFDGTWFDNGNTGSKDDIERKEGWFSRFYNSTATQLGSAYDGSYSWVCFKVNATGSASANFSNSTTTPEIKSMLNSFSSTAAKARFNFSQGATGIPGIDAIVGGVTNAVKGFASGVSILGLVSLAGTSFIDIPDTWEDSSASMPTESYDIHLRTPYGNTLSRYMNLSIPLSMLLAGALPISTGRQTYASPFICKLISVGHSNMDLAMIDSLNVTHGVGNLGYTRDNKPLQIDVNLTFKDLNRSVHAPIDTGGSLLNPLNAASIFDDDNNFNYYINTLAGVSVIDQTLATRRLARNVRLKMLQYSSFFSTSHLTMASMESMPGRALRSLANAGTLLPGDLFSNIAPEMNKIR